MITYYPNTLCNCFNDSKINDSRDKLQGTDTNMCVKNCNFSSLKCNLGNRRPNGEEEVFKKQIEPRLLFGYDILNKNVFNYGYDQTFNKVECPNNEEISGCNDIVYTSSDPRLVSVPNGGQVMTLDRPPLNAKIKLDEMYTDPGLSNYKTGYYDGYKGVNAGDIVYYIDKNIEDNYSLPNYTIASHIKGTLYIDPMNGIRPVYTRTPIKNNNLLDTKNRTYTSGLSFLDDTLENREDLMGRQKTNKRRYESRWTGNIFQ
jgi:hypothetical protein